MDTEVLMTNRAWGWPWSITVIFMNVYPYGVLRMYMIVKSRDYVRHSCWKINPLGSDSSGSKHGWEPGGAPVNSSCFLWRLLHTHCGGHSTVASWVTRTSSFPYYFFLFFFYFFPKNYSVKSFLFSRAIYFNRYDNNCFRQNKMSMWELNLSLTKFVLLKRDGVTLKKKINIRNNVISVHRQIAFSRIEVCIENEQKRDSNL